MSDMYRQERGIKVNNKQNSKNKDEILSSNR